jgi:hypothetical protein
MGGDCSDSTCMQQGTYTVSTDGKTLTLVNAATGETSTLPLQVAVNMSSTDSQGSVTPQAGMVIGDPTALMPINPKPLTVEHHVTKVGQQSVVDGTELIVDDCTEGDYAFENWCKRCHEPGVTGCLLFSCNGFGVCNVCPPGGKPCFAYSLYTQKASPLQASLVPRVPRFSPH